MAQGNNYDRSKYPWRPADIKHGDYERIYDTYFDRMNPQYQSTYSSSDMMDVSKATIEMQFGRFITDFDTLMIIQKKVDAFMQNLRSKPFKVFAFQLACTCHWVGLMVVVVNGQMFFYYFDSKNVDCYGLDRDQIEEKVSEIDRERVKAGKTPWSPFKVQCQVMSLGDINILLKLIPAMFMRETNIYEHVFKTNFQEQYQEYWYPTIVKPMETYSNNTLIHDHLVTYLGDLKTFMHYFVHMARGHEYLAVETKESLIEVYLQVFATLDRCLKTISRYKKGREIMDVWDTTKLMLGSHFQPKY